MKDNIDTEALPMNGSLTNKLDETVLAIEQLWAVYLLNTAISNPMTVKTIIRT